ncbi:unnamed protein product [Notodromas monacha]|uniref:Uncharacterized protein n=1 Tax=Notodromas monacha TaxID=399045 RepID=A0A7R9BPQ8_9CRUS|nr:unnamed protein product [Notodromas monacha]CAG0918049.1 unnamed protein product [Notodromas monacha]
MPSMAGRAMNFAGKFSFGFALAAFLQYVLWMRKLKVLNETMFRIASSLGIPRKPGGIIPGNATPTAQISLDINGDNVISLGATSQAERLNVKRDFRKLVMKLQAEIREYRLQSQQAADSLHLASQRFKNFECRLMDLEAEDGLLQEDAAFLRVLRNEFVVLAKERLEKSLRVQEMAHFTIPEARKELEVCELKLQNIETLRHLMSQIESLETSRRTFHQVWGPLPSNSAVWLAEPLMKQAANLAVHQQAKKLNQQKASSLRTSQGSRAQVNILLLEASAQEGWVVVVEQNQMISPGRKRGRGHEAMRGCLGSSSSQLLSFARKTHRGIRGFSR